MPSVGCQPALLTPLLLHGGTVTHSLPRPHPCPRLHPHFAPPAVTLDYPFGKANALPRLARRAAAAAGWEGAVAWLDSLQRAQLVLLDAGMAMRLSRGYLPACWPGLGWVVCRAGRWCVLGWAVVCAGLGGGVCWAGRWCACSPYCSAPMAAVLTDLICTWRLACALLEC